MHVSVRYWMYSVVSLFVIITGAKEVIRESKACLCFLGRGQYIPTVQCA